MARATEIDLARDEFRREIESSTRLLKDMRKVLDQEALPFSARESKDYIEKIAEVAFLKLVISWEAFLERTLVLYLIGKKAGNGYCPVRLVGSIQDEERAYKLLSGNLDFKIESRYLEYLLDAEKVMKAVDFFFDNHRYNLIKEYSIFIKHVRNIRNHIAHNSQSSRSNFEKATRFFMNTKNSYDGTVGEFLLSPVRQNSGIKISGEGWTHFDGLSVFFATLSVEIAPE